MNRLPAAADPLRRLVEIMARLRDPNGGCPWDLEQDFSTIAPHTLEEAYEVADAIERGDMEHLQDELGDLLFQVVFYCQMAREAGHFDLDGVAEAIATKMVRRHPHVFGDAVIEDAAAQTRAWEEFKAEERKAKAPQGSGAGASAPEGALDGVILGLPALTRALKLQTKAARVGFDWSEHAPIIAKLHEELDEVEHEMKDGGDRARLADEIGDLLFVCVNLARHLDVEPEGALRGANAKFERRFRLMERYLRDEGRRPEDCTLAELDALWERAKADGA